MQININVNGTDHSLDVEPRRLLVDAIRSDLIQADANALAFTVNTQILPHFVRAVFGEKKGVDAVSVAWDVSPPKDRNAEATALVTASNAMKLLTDELARHERGILERALSLNRGNMTKTAKILGISRSTLYEKCRKFNLQSDA